MYCCRQVELFGCTLAASASLHTGLSSMELLCQVVVMVFRWYMRNESLWAALYITRSHSLPPNALSQLWPPSRCRAEAWTPCACKETPCCCVPPPHLLSVRLPGTCSSLTAAATGTFLMHTIGLHVRAFVYPPCSFSSLPPTNHTLSHCIYFPACFYLFHCTSCICSHRSNAILYDALCRHLQQEQVEQWKKMCVCVCVS